MLISNKIHYFRNFHIQIYNIMKYNLFDNFYEVIEVIYNLPDNLEKRANRTFINKTYH